MSLTHGRPLMVHSAMSQGHLILPSDIDDAYLTRQPDSPGSQPDGVPSLVHCFTQAVQLQEILGHVLTSFYYGTAPAKRSNQNLPEGFSGNAKGSSKVGAIGNSDLQRILNVDADLFSWHQKVPSHLKIETYNNSIQQSNISPAREALYKRQAMVLECR